MDGELWDLERPLEKSCKLELLDFEHPEGKKKKNTDVFPWKVVYTVYFYIKEKRFSGILLRMFWERLPRDIMVVIYVSVLQLMMDFFTRWLLRNGEFPRLLVIWFL